ncbi:hypothetical protein K438DRAFT_1971600 [Mycena galopus ATCC 62051]|nr:hypothetical protein K438DRAFT_1971600 [Mycena galopus ATCC 62051]
MLFSPDLWSCFPSPALLLFPMKPDVAPRAFCAPPIPRRVWCYDFLLLISYNSPSPLRAFYIDDSSPLAPTDFAVTTAFSASAPSTVSHCAAVPPTPLEHAPDELGGGGWDVRRLVCLQPHLYVLLGFHFTPSPSSIYPFRRSLPLHILHTLTHTRSSLSSGTEGIDYTGVHVELERGDKVLLLEAGGALLGEGTSELDGAANTSANTSAGVPVPSTSTSTSGVMHPCTADRVVAERWRSDALLPIAVCSGWRRRGGEGEYEDFGAGAGTGASGSGNSAGASASGSRSQDARDEEMDGDKEGEGGGEADVDVDVEEGGRAHAVGLVKREGGPTDTGYSLARVVVGLDIPPPSARPLCHLPLPSPPPPPSSPPFNRPPYSSSFPPSLFISLLPSSLTPLTHAYLHAHRTSPGSPSAPCLAYMKAASAARFWDRFPALFQLPP